MAKRLTEKETNILSSNGYHKCDYLLNGTPKYKALNKLGQLEDIEEKLGIDLITLFKALTIGFYIKIKNFKATVFIPKSDTRLVIHGAGWEMLDNQAQYERAINQNDIQLMNRWQGWYVLVKDYGTTWALTKEELENYGKKEN